MDEKEKQQKAMMLEHGIKEICITLSSLNLCEQDAISTVASTLATMIRGLENQESKAYLMLVVVYGLISAIVDEGSVITFDNLMTADKVN